MAPDCFEPISPKRILLVEDDLLVAHTLRMVLVVDGHQVEIAGDAETALDMFDPARYDLVITDFSLPNKDGLELAVAIKNRGPSRPIILITAYAEAVNGMGRVTNIDALLGKPISRTSCKGQ
jgi:DNA-binding response OmpR family regulator